MSTRVEMTSHLNHANRSSSTLHSTSHPGSGPKGCCFMTRSSLSHGVGVDLRRLGPSGARGQRDERLEIDDIRESQNFVP
jgi:hypothetical protein